MRSSSKMKINFLCTHAKTWITVKPLVTESSHMIKQCMVEIICLFSGCFGGLSRSVLLLLQLFLSHCSRSSLLRCGHRNKVVSHTVTVSVMTHPSQFQDTAVFNGIWTCQYAVSAADRNTNQWPLLSKSHIIVSFILPSNYIVTAIHPPCMEIPITSLTFLLGFLLPGRLLPLLSYDGQSRQVSPCFVRLTRLVESPVCTHLTLTLDFLSGEGVCGDKRFTMRSCDKMSAQT